MANKKISDYTSQTLLASGDYVLIQRSSAYYKVDADNLAAHLSTDDLSEGVSNLYFTNERAQDAIGSALYNTGNDVTLSYDDANNRIEANINSLNVFSTDNLPESSTQLYIKKKVATVPHSEILALNSTPIQISDAPPNADSTIHLLGAQFFFENDGTTAYTNSGLELVDQAAGETLFKVDSDLLNTTDSTRIQTAIPATTSGIVVQNRAIYLTATSSDPTGGDANNNLHVILVYVTHDWASLLS